MKTLSLLVLLAATLNLVYAEENNPNDVKTITEAMRSTKPFTKIRMLESDDYYGSVANKFGTGDCQWVDNVESNGRCMKNASVTFDMARKNITVKYSYVLKDLDTKKRYELTHALTGCEQKTLSSNYDDMASSNATGWVFVKCRRATVDKLKVRANLREDRKTQINACLEREQNLGKCAKAFELEIVNERISRADNEWYTVNLSEAYLDESMNYFGRGHYFTLKGPDLSLDF